MKVHLVHKMIEVTWHWVGQSHLHNESFRYVGPERDDYVKAITMSNLWYDDAIRVDAVVQDVDDILIESICFDGIVW